MSIPWKMVAVIVLLGTVGIAGCTSRSVAPEAATAQRLETSYQSIRAALEKDGPQIDYDTLVNVYQVMISSPEQIPHIDELLRLMIDQRNPDPRIDQMVLIYAVQIIGKSRFPIPGDQALFNRILDQGADRLNYWVLTYVADAILNYKVDLPDGDALVDRVEQWKAYNDRHFDPDQEFFGNHFLPPPRAPVIINHIAGIQDRRLRQRERNSYYVMIANRIPETMIVTAFKYVTTRGMPDSGKIPPAPLTAIWKNWQRLPEEAKTPRR